MKSISTQSFIVYGLLPYLGWILALTARPFIIHPPESSTSQVIQREQINSVDQLSLGLHSEVADRYSYYTQNGSGLFALCLGLIYYSALIQQRKLNLLQASFALIQIDGWLLTQVVGWNGLLNELTHALTQRTRPFVYTLSTYAPNPAHYTSFYSGHTSFSSTVITTALLLLAHRLSLVKKGQWLFWLAMALGFSLIFSTGYLRIIAGRHFLSDVLGGAIVGSWIAAYFFNQWQSKNTVCLTPAHADNCKTEAA